MKIFVAHASDFNFKKKLYEPIRASVLNKEHEFFLPQETEEDNVTLELIKSCDAVIVDFSISSTGAGIEAGWANALGIPILGIYEKGSRPSSFASYVCTEYVEYTDPQDMLTKISSFINSHGK